MNAWYNIIYYRDIYIANMLINGRIRQAGSMYVSTYHAFQDLYRNIATYGIMHIE